MKKFKTESEKVLEIMINSIYTNKEIFLRELISNASDAIDKLYYKSLQENLGLSRGDFKIRIEADKDKRILRIIDNGIGMTAEELENNLGVIARSGSMDFKAMVESKDDINIIGQFGVGFYSAFMVSEKVEVLSKAYGSNEANLWSSSGVQGYNVKKAQKDEYGTTITMYIKPDGEEEHYGEFLEEYRLRSLIKKYSDYVRYPIIMNVEKTRYPEKDEAEGEDKTTEPETYRADETLNSMIPLWKKKKSDITDKEYNDYYKDTFYDYEDPVKVIHTSTEGIVNYQAILYIPGKAPYNYYSKGYEKGLKLYNSGIMIMEKCAELLPDYFSFVKGVVDSELTLNISRETVQQDHQLKKIAANLKTKIKKELIDLLEKDREKYEKFYGEFGLQLKYGIYEGWGMNKEELKDLIMFKSLNSGKLTTLKEYITGMKEDQKYIYYASGKSTAAIKALPQSEKIIDLGYDILCFTDEVDEFSVKVLGEYDKKEFRSVSSGDTGIKEEEKAAETDKDKEVLAFIKESLSNEVAEVTLSKRLKTHPVCLTAKGELSIEMEKVMSALPNSDKIAAEKVLEINASHPIYGKLQALYESDKDALKQYASILLTQAKLIEGLAIENPAEYSDMVLRKLAE